MTEAAWGPVNALDQRQGCAWFTDAQQPLPSTGWYSVAGAPAQAFSADQPLPTGVVFWSNLSSAQTWGLGRWQHVRSAEWWGDSLVSCRQDAPAYGSAETAVAGWSEIVQRMGLFWSQWAKQATPNKPWAWGEGSIAEAVQARHPIQAHDTEGLPGLLVKETSQVSVKVQWPSGPWGKWRKMVLRRSAVAHLRGLRDLRVPQGPWTRWPCEDASHMERKVWLHSQDRPLLVRVGAVTWNPGQSEQGEMWLGQRGRVFSAASLEPFWVTGEEAYELEGLADVAWIDAYTAQGWQRLQIDPQWLPDDTAPLQPLSMTQHWAAASAWRSWWGPGRHPDTRQPLPDRSAWLWVQAWDRAQMRRRAQGFLDCGAVLLEYGNGQITVAWPEQGTAPEMVAACRQGELLVPPLLAQALPPTDINLDSIHDALHWLDAQARQHPQVRWDIDRLVFPWADQGTKKVRQVMQEAAARLLSLPLPAPLAKAWKERLKVQAQHSVERLTSLTR